MAKLIDKLWNWGHLEGSHNVIVGMDCKMTPEQFAKEYGIKNAFIVSYGGNIQPPFAPFAKRFSGLNEVKWSVLGDASTPLPEAELGNTQDILDVLTIGKNITGGIVDDFFSPERMARFTPEVLKKIKQKLNANGLDFWCVLYNSQLDFDLAQYMECFDGITFWVWGADKLDGVEEYLKKLFTIAKGKPVMLGIYLWDYLDEGTKPMDPVLFEKQLKRYFGLLENGEIEGVIFCSSTVGDADLETNKILKRYIAEYGDREIKK
ncbi:MAG: hypothetical protein IJA89_02690 [Clostridia bacterium]|nr:hypothetical protein [Clostridia bacterium]